MLSYRRISKRLMASRRAQTALGVVAAEYLRLIWRSKTSLVIDPPDIYERVEPHLPVIVTMWHGHHFLVPFVRRRHRVKVLVSRHRDGEINAVAGERLGLQTIRGSGDHGGRFAAKGGVAAFQSMLAALSEGYVVALTADVPKVARVAGQGIVKLAQLSGRPIYPVAVATSRRLELRNWDRTVVHFPFSRLSIVVGEPIWVPQDAGGGRIEACRARVESELNAATSRAYALVERRLGKKDRG
jgi:lysophospholipid acyltransferase (LPLAT)-like uncharacterized protein